MVSVPLSTRLEAVIWLAIKLLVVMAEVERAIVDPLNAAPGRIPLTELTLMDCAEIVSAWTVVAEMKFVEPIKAAPGMMPLMEDTFKETVERAWKRPVPATSRVVAGAAVPMPTFDVEP
jgi:hypothetical protein